MREKLPRVRFNYADEITIFLVGALPSVITTLCIKWSSVEIAIVWQQVRRAITTLYLSVFNSRLHEASRVATSPISWNYN